MLWKQWENKDKSISWSYVMIPKSVYAEDELMPYREVLIEMNNKLGTDYSWVIKLFDGLPKFMRVSREGLALLECQFLRVWSLV